MLLFAMGHGSRIAVSEMTAGGRTITGSSAVMDAQVLNRAGLEMAAGRRTTAGVSAVMDLQELHCNFIVLSCWQLQHNLRVGQ